MMVVMEDHWPQMYKLYRPTFHAPYHDVWLHSELAVQSTQTSDPKRDGWTWIGPIWTGFIECSSHDSFFLTSCDRFVNYFQESTPQHRWNFWWSICETFHIVSRNVGKYNLRTDGCLLKSLNRNYRPRRFRLFDVVGLFCVLFTSLSFLFPRNVR